MWPHALLPAHLVLRPAQQRLARSGLTLSPISRVSHLLELSMLSVRIVGRMECSSRPSSSMWDRSQESLGLQHHAQQGIEEKIPGSSTHAIRRLGIPDYHSSSILPDQVMLPLGTRKYLPTSELLLSTYMPGMALYSLGTSMEFVIRRLPKCSKSACKLPTTAHEP